MSIWNNLVDNNKNIDFLKNIKQIPNALLIVGDPISKKK